MQRTLAIHTLSKTFLFLQLDDFYSCSVAGTLKEPVANGCIFLEERSRLCNEHGPPPRPLLGWNVVTLAG